MTTKRNKQDKAVYDLRTGNYLPPTSPPIFLSTFLTSKVSMSSPDDRGKGEH